ncbi:bifunctional diguanylate cyclase/phosphodiesterase [Billgrantia kenyensis]|uniref:cyclic-guanylate-specific phosphodiesterase n=1 Tax=Billgrantia kenyensis TaxID=321266 RepID=A0A7V9W0M9_9GAMM|nr:EAL domain-containing protein [Halomonas kenyensis]MBA2778893.1 EAL domain-containing protein [Halomonas kenyensis]MCG6662820.1 EAL domain-containing protein [Halomonas kenyensis]
MTTSGGKRERSARQRWSAWQASLFYCVMMALLLAMITWALWDMRERELEAARVGTQGHAELVAEWATSAFARTDDTLSGTANLFALSLVEEASPWLADAFNSLLEQRQRSLPFLESLGIINHLGEPLYTTRPQGSDYQDPQEREFIRRFLNDPEQALSAAYWNPEESGHRMLYLRRMFDADGSFTGVAAAHLDLFYFTHALQSIQLSQGESIAFVDDEHRLIARHPSLEGLSVTQALGRQVDTSEVAELMRADRDQSAITTSPLDGERRLFGMGRVDGLPFAVIVGKQVDRVLAGWRDKVMVFVLAWLIVALLGAFLLRHYLRLARTEEALHLSDQRLRGLNESLQAELDIAALAFETHLGMFITDASGAIRKVNSTFEEITGYRAEEVLGENPRILSSGRHDADFFRAMWASIHTHGSWQGEVWNRRKNSEIYPQRVTISEVRDGAGKPSHYVATLSDISEHRAAQQQAHRLAFYDPLTGLPNRRMLLERLGRAMKEGAAQARQGALLFIDLDGFKHINDTLGHQTGDELLRLMSRRLVEASGQAQLVSRLGGDEFVVLAEDMGESIKVASTQVERLANRLLAMLAEPCWLGARRHLLSGSVGVTLLNDGAEDAEACLQQAEMAMYQAKQAGRNTWRFYDPAMQAVAVRRAMLESELRQAVPRNQLRLYYQVQVDRRGRVTGVEALLRWQHPGYGMVPPYDFISIAEESYLIVPIGEWVMETACRQLAAWAAEPYTEGLSMAVNISPLQFQQPEFVGRLETILAATGARPERLKLEITESLFMEEPDAVRDTMLRIKALGVRFSLDDFGTGYSSLSYLNRLPLDQLKIDQSFVRTLFEDNANAVICASVIDLGRNLGLEVIAEGVETEEHRDWLENKGCHAYQGYLFGRPLPLGELEPLLRESACIAGR